MNDATKIGVPIIYDIHHKLGIDVSNVRTEIAVRDFKKGEVFSSQLNECKVGILCQPKLFFEQIEECALCGKLM